MSAWGTRMRWSAVAVVILAVAACTGDQPEPAPTAPPTTGPAPVTEAATGAAQTGAAVPACDLLSAADVEAAVGAPVERGDDATATGRVCTWDGPDGEVSVTLQSFRGEAGDFDTTVESIEARYDATERVTGVGDRAVWMFSESVGVTLAQMIATGGDDLVAVTIGGMADEREARSATEALVTTVLEGLGGS